MYKSGISNRVLTICIVSILWISVLVLQPLAYSLDEDIDWVDMSPSTAPLARRSAGMAYDTESDLVILFSGRNPSLPVYLRYCDTWTYNVDTNTWTNVTPEVSPPPRGTMGGLEYDNQSDRVIFFGGVKPGEPFRCFGDTWAYDCNSNTWENKTPTDSPTPSASHNMVYDSESDRIVLYGGMYTNTSFTGDRGTLGETWAYDYDSNTWTKMNPATDPDLRYAFGLAYDRESDRVILFGGKYRNNGYSEIMDETWAYDFNTDTWTNMSPSVAPPNRNRFQMTYHAGWDRVILFGGDNGRVYDDTWAYDFNNNNWTQLSVDNHPTARVYADLAYDDESESIVLFGGINATGDVFGDTWVLSTATNGTWDIFLLILLATGAGVVILVLVVLVRRR